jgi:hypothetical protein
MMIKEKDIQADFFEFAEKHNLKMEYKSIPTRTDYDTGEFESFHFDITINGETFQYSMGLGHSPFMQKKGNYNLKVRTVEELKKIIRTETGYKFEQWLYPAPTLIDVIYSISMDSDVLGQSFESWASDFGYDTDSRKAEKTYRDCQDNANKLIRIVGLDNIETLREILQDY